MAFSHEFTHWVSISPFQQNKKLNFIIIFHKIRKKLFFIIVMLFLEIPSNFENTYVKKFLDTIRNRITRLVKRRYKSNWLLLNLTIALYYYWNLRNLFKFRSNDNLSGSHFNVGIFNIFPHEKLHKYVQKIVRVEKWNVHLHQWISIW